LALHGDNRPWRAVLVGGLVATLPDLDVLFSTGSPIADVRAHRGQSHSLLWLSIASVPIAHGLAVAFGERARFLRWWAAVWLALFTHPLLDALTVYGTKLALPFSEHAFAVGCIFVIDPLFTSRCSLASAATCAAARARARDGTGAACPSRASMPRGASWRSNSRRTPRGRSSWRRACRRSASS
jgi:inner membrane protein